MKNAMTSSAVLKEDTDVFHNPRRRFHMLHYGSKEYKEAVSDAARNARTKIEGMIEKGQERGNAVVQKVVAEQPQDRLIRSEAFNVLPGMVDDWDSKNHALLGSVPGLQLQIPGQDGFEALHKNAFTQLCERAGIRVPGNFARELTNVDPELMADMLNRLYKNDMFKNRRFLLRSFDGQARGWLSDKYRRLDSRPTLDAFIGAATKGGMVPVEGYTMSTKVALKMLLPKVFEPAPNEVVAFGLSWENSDYGNGAQSVRAFVMRCWCTNFAIAEECLRQIHLGKRLSDDISYSSRTYKLDTEATASAIADIAENTLNPKRVEEYCSVIKQAHEEKVDVKTMLNGMKSRIAKADLEEVKDVFNSPDVENLPPGNTAWRLSNALSWVAGKKEDGGDRLDLMKEAGKLVPFGQAI